MEEKLRILFRAYFGREAGRLELLPASGSARRYYRLGAGDICCIGTWNEDVTENRLFIDFSRHFRAKGLQAPEIYAVGKEEDVYIQQDLGDTMLLHVAEHPEGEGLSGRAMDLYRKALKELLRFQFIGTRGWDYSRCIPRPVFDRRCMSWDLNYFKYCFLRLAGAFFSEERLEDDFERLVGSLEKVEATTFMFRDFQSRNILVKEDKVWFIDYQGGRRGALHYDVASLLYDAVVKIPQVQREELLDFYIAELQAYRPVDAVVFRRDYYRFVLMRLLQAMGAFGLRGLYEGKRHFIDSIAPGLEALQQLLSCYGLEQDYPEIAAVVSRCCTSWNTGRKEA